MITRWETETTVIGRLRVRQQAGESTLAQQRIGAVVRNAQLRPSWLPASAILCLQKFCDPAPSIRWVSYNRTHPPPEWEQSATRELDRLVAQAVRPALTSVPASAEAVLFADRAEMLACLAVDWLRGTLRSSWWWMTLLHHDDAEAVLAREWISSPQFVPLALDYLASRSQLIAFVTRMPEELASTLLSRVLNAFGIPNVKKAEHGADRQTGTAPEQQKSRAGMPSASRPWSRAVPEADAPELTPLEQVFVAQALMLRRAPATARSAGFQTAIAHWQDQLVRVHPDTADSERKPVNTLELLEATEGDFRTTSSDVEAALPGATGEDSPVDTDDLADSPAHQTVTSPKPPLTETTQSKAFGSSSNPKTPKVRSRWVESRPEATSPPDAQNVGQRAGDAEGAIALAQPAAMTNVLSPDLRVQSAFAGVFFLVNVALRLGLYSDFTSPQGENLDLDLWDFLWLLAAQFVGDEIGPDPLNTVLANLAGRTVAERPSASFHPPQDWQIPIAWLEPFPELFEWKEVVHDDRVLVAHPAGFLLKDEAVERTLDNRTDLKRWIDWVARYVRARLVRAIGRDDAAEFLCCVAGEVVITGMHVDLYYSLKDYPTEIRLAGLDRDPGWVPAAGRYVAYQFD